MTELLLAPGKLGIPGISGTRNLRDNISDLKAQVNILGTAMCMRACTNPAVMRMRPLVLRCARHFFRSLFPDLQSVMQTVGQR